MQCLRRHFPGERGGCDDTSLHGGNCGGHFVRTGTEPHRVPRESDSVCHGTAELPFPSAKSVGQLIWDKAKDFLERAFTIIFVATIVIWFLQTFDLKLNVVTDSEKSLLALVGQWIAPLFGPLGFRTGGFLRR